MMLPLPSLELRIALSVSQFLVPKHLTAVPSTHLAHFKLLSYFKFSFLDLNNIEITNYYKINFSALLPQTKIQLLSEKQNHFSGKSTHISLFSPWGSRIHPKFASKNAPSIKPINFTYTSFSHNL